MADSMKLPFIDLRDDIESHWGEYSQAVLDVLKSGQFINGPTVEAFEEQAAAYLGVDKAVGVNSGTDALVIALRAAGVGPGHEVIVPSFSFFATAEAVSAVGAKPLFIDIEQETFCMDPELLEALLEDRGAQKGQARAIIPVHLFGHAAHMDKIMAVASRYRLSVIEDSAQAFGGSYKGRKLGTIGDIGAFSFFPTKNLGGIGDGGLLSTKKRELADTARSLRAHGATSRLHHERVAYNSRLDAIQAAFLAVKLRHIDASIQRRQSAAAQYSEALADLNEIVTPTSADYADHSYHQYTLRVLGGKRDVIAARLKSQGIPTMIYYPTPIHRAPVYSAMNCPALPVTEQMAREVLSLPFWAEISSEQQGSVVDELRKALSAA